MVWDEHSRLSAFLGEIHNMKEVVDGFSKTYKCEGKNPI